MTRAGILANISIFGQESNLCVVNCYSGSCGQLEKLVAMSFPPEMVEISAVDQGFAIDF